VEVLYKEDLETDALTPAILSSVTAYTVFCSYKGFDHVFAYSSEAFHSPLELPFYAVLGLVCSGMGYLYVNFLHGSKRLFFDRLPVNKYVVPPIGGLLVGLVGYFYPQAIGQGFGYVQQLILREPVDGLPTSAGFLLTLAVMKIATTSFTISSGGSGGVFAPSLFIGAMLGGCVGTVSQQFFPAYVPDVIPFVVVGMGAFFAGVANAPIASLMMVCELTGAYELLPPLMVVAIVALMASRRWSIYTTQVDNKFSTKAHLWEMNPNDLRRTTIAKAMRGVYGNAAVIPHDLPLTEVEAFASGAGETDLVLKDEHGRLAGLLALNDLGDSEDLEPLRALAVADDLVNRRGGFLHPDQDLIRALEFFGEAEFDKAPVVERGEGARLLGYIRYRDILDFYARQNPSPEDQPAAPGTTPRPG